jgi:hypothetical protein
MFLPLMGCAIVDREEPSVKLSEAASFVKKRNSKIAMKVVLKDKLGKKTKARATKKMRYANELHARMQAIKPFIESWQRWSDFYEDAAYTWTPKTGSHVSCIENILKECEEKELDFDVVIACGFKAYDGKTKRISINVLRSYYEDFYNQYYEEVMNDIDKEESKYRSL